MVELRKKTIVVSILYIFLFSSVYVLTKMIVPPLNGFSYVFLRSFGGMIFLFFTLLFRRKLRGLNVFYKENWKTLLPVTIYLTLSLLLSYVATQFTTPANQSLIFNLTSVLIILLNFLLFKVVPKKMVVLSAGITLVGILFLLHPLELSGNTTIEGDVIMISSTVFGAIYHIKLKPLAAEHDSFQISFTLALFISLYTVPLFIVVDGPSQFLQLTSLQLLILTLLAIGISGLLYSFSAVMMNDPAVTSNIMAIIMTLVPIFGTIIGVIVYGERMSGVNIIGAITVVVGVFIINLQKETKSEDVVEQKYPIEEKLDILLDDV